MKIRHFIVVFLILAIAGCVPSLHPLYTADTVAFRSDMLGDWVDADDKNNSWLFEKNDNSKLPSYKLKLTDKKIFQDAWETFHYEVHLVKLEDYYFLDFIRDLTDEEQAILDDGIAPMIAAHSFARIDFKDNAMTLRMFDYEFVENLFKQQKIRLKHETLTDGTIVLTAPTEDLQKFVVKYANDPAAFGEELKLVRKES